MRFSTVKVLQEENLCQDVLGAKYAVRGVVPIRANEIK